MAARGVVVRRGDRQMPPGPGEMLLRATCALVGLFAYRFSSNEAVTGIHQEMARPVCWFRQHAEQKLVYVLKRYHSNV